MIKIGRCSFDILSVVGRELTFHFSISDYAWMIEWIMSIYNWCVVSQITYKKRFGTANGRYFCKKVVKVPWLIDPIRDHSQTTLTAKGEKLTWSHNWAYIMYLVNFSTKRKGVGQNPANIVLEWPLSAHGSIISI